MGVVEMRHSGEHIGNSSAPFDDEDLAELAPDPPQGPLDHYRSQASFNWKHMRLLLEDPKVLKIKMKVWRQLHADPIFAHPKVTPLVDEQKRRTAVQLKRLAQLGLVPESVHSMSYKNKTGIIMTVNAATAAWNKNLSVKFALGVSLFTNCLLSLGTERHLPYINSVWRNEMLTAIAITEVGHGSNTKRVRTTATYDADTREFVIHTPDFEAAKCWVGNLGKTCTHALVFAQLVTEGDDTHGLHAFLVPIRNPETMIAFPGVTVGDVGEKAGLNGIDNGFVMFDHYRIPRVNLLNRVGDITEEGEYESSFQNPQQILGATLENLSAGRVAISQESTNDLCTAVTVAIRYAAVRKQFGPRGSKEELRILEYPLHQWRLFPYVAAACAFKVFVADLTEDYLECVDRSYRGGQISELTSMASEVHAMVSACKPLVTWTCAAAIQEAREACGGHGYLRASGLAGMREDHDASVTYEGDNNVLLQQSSNWLVRRWSDVKRGNASDILDGSPLGSVHFLVDADKILKRRFTGTSVSDVANGEFVKNTLQWLVCWLLKSLNDKLNELSNAGKDRFHARNHTQVFYAKPLSIVYGELNVLSSVLHKVKTPGISAELSAALEKLSVLYGLWCLNKHLHLLYQGGFGNGSQLADLIKESCQWLCDKLKPDIVPVIDAIAPPDIVLKSILGLSDGKIYDHLRHAYMSQPGVLDRASWWQEIAVKPQSKL